MDICGMTAYEHISARHDRLRIHTYIVMYMDICGMTAHEHKRMELVQ